MAIRIDAAARGQVRLFRQKIMYSSARIRSLTQHPDLIDDVQIWRHKTNARGRERVQTRIQHALPGVRWGRINSDVRELTGPVLVGSFLDNSGPTIVEPRDPGQTQESVVVRYVLISATGIYSGLWTLEVPIHALGRVAQRLPDADLSEILYAGHGRLLATAADEIKPGTGFWLPTPPIGAFYCEVIIGPDESSHGELTIYMRARTWIHDDQLRDEQRPIRAAVNGEAKLADALLLPLPIRKLQFDGRNLLFRPRVPC